MRTVNLSPMVHRSIRLAMTTSRIRLSSLALSFAIAILLLASSFLAFFLSSTPEDSLLIEIARFPALIFFGISYSEGESIATASLVAMIVLLTLTVFALIRSVRLLSDRL